MNLLTILSLLAAAVSTGAKVAKGKQQQEYVENVNDQTAEQRKRDEEDLEKQNYANRRASLTRAIGSDNVYHNPMRRMDLAPISPLDTSFYDNVSGVANLAGSAAGYGAGKGKGNIEFGSNDLTADNIDFDKLNSYNPDKYNPDILSSPSKGSSASLSGNRNSIYDPDFLSFPYKRTTSR